jgi:hypothetical protein
METLNSKFAEYNIPEHMWDALKLWITDAIEPGSFLTAVLCNDLKEAIGRADDVNINHLKDFVRFLYWEVPSACWGSIEKVQAWRGIGVTQ